VAEANSLRILECDCLEGGHTSVLAQAFPEVEITAVDVRETSLEKAKFILSASGIKKCSTDQREPE
jgi:trans-aconitate methyltransferase